MYPQSAQLGTDNDHRGAHDNAPASVAGMEKSDLLNELLDLERQGWDSLCNSTGADFYGSLMLHDAVMVLAHGFVMDRDTVIASLDKAPPWRTYEISDAQVIRAGTDTAILVYAGVAYQESRTPAFIGLMSSVYVRTDSRWKLALYQQTLIPATERYAGRSSVE